MYTSNMKNTSKIYTYLVDIIIILTVAFIVYILISEYNQKVSVTIDDRPTKYHRDVDPSTDLIYGNPNADIFIVEYGDLQCPHCKDIHTNIKRVIEGPQGVTGRVAWVWRDGFHLGQISVEKAETLQCLIKYGGVGSRSKAWSFIEESLYGGVLELEYPYDRYKDLLEQLDLPFERIDQCRKDNDVSDEITLALKDIIELDLTETPLLHFISSEGELLFEVTGVLSTEEIEAFIQTVLTSSIGKE